MCNEERHGFECRSRGASSKCAMRRSDTDLSEEAEEQVDVEQDLQEEARTDELADVKLDDDGDDDDKLANAPAWYLAILLSSMHLIMHN